MIEFFVRKDKDAEGYTELFARVGNKTFRLDGFWDTSQAESCKSMLEEIDLYNLRQALLLDDAVRLAKEATNG